MLPSNRASDDFACRVCHIGAGASIAPTRLSGSCVYLPLFDEFSILIGHIYLTQTFFDALNYQHVD